MTNKGSKIKGVSNRKEVIPFNAPMLPTRISSDIYACAYKFNIPTIGWDDPMYVIYGGKLHQAFIKRISFDIINRCSTYTLDIAGIGVVDTHCCTWNERGFSMFANISDFTDNKEYPITSDHEIAIKNVFSEVSYCGKYFEIKGFTNAAFRLVQYMWDEHTLSVKKVYAQIPPIIIYDDKRGFHFDDYVMANGVYSTAEECIRYNTIDVVLFKPNELKEWLGIYSKKPLFKIGTRFKLNNCVYVVRYISDNNSVLLTIESLGVGFGYELVDIKPLDYLIKLFEKGELIIL